MALYRYSVGDRVSRGKGQSSLRSAAYLARACYEDRRTGWVHDFTGKKSPILEASDHIARAGRHAEMDSRQEVVFSGLYAPANAPDWCVSAENIERFWNAAEAAERRSDAQIAERFILAIPHEFTLEQAVWAVQDHVREFTRQGRVVQVAIHSHEPGHDERNLHAHLMVSLRGVDENGLKPHKAQEQQERWFNRSAYVEHLRENWAHVLNRHLARHGFEAKLDHRSYRRQGLDLEPLAHMGPGDAAREQRGEPTAVGDHNRAVVARNAEKARQRYAEHPDPEPPTPAAPAARQRQSLDQAAREHEQQHQRATPGPQQRDERDEHPSYWRAMAKTAGEAAQRPQRPIWEQPAHPHAPRLSDEQREALETAAMADKVESGWRRLELEDVAKRLSPAYAKGVKRCERLETLITKTTRTIDWLETQRDVEKYRYEEHREQMGFVRKVLHDRNILPDMTLKAHEAGERRAERGAERLQIRRGALVGELNVTRRRTEAALDAIREEAAAELAECRALAEDARQQLQADRLAERQSQRHGPRM